MKKVLPLILLTGSVWLHAQTAADPPGNAAWRPHLAFEVAAIHPSSPDAVGGMVKPLPNGTGYLVQNMTVKTLMSTMYRIPARQIIGGPDWFNTDHFDVEARADGSYGMEDLHTMFKDLLAERFGLKYHVEAKEGPVYALVIARSGLKMKQDGPVGDLNIPITPTGPGEFEGKKVPIPYLCWFLGNILRDESRPVIDKTGLTGVYDFKLSFALDLPPGANLNGAPADTSNRPVLKDALPEQLGLALEAGKGPVDYYVIDSIQRPSAN